MELCTIFAPAIHKARATFEAPLTYEEIKTWQTGIGALLGFVALLSGALFNSYLNRKRDDRLRQADADAIMIALLSEILVLRRAIAASSNSVSNRYLTYQGARNLFNEHVIADIQVPEPFLYRKMAEKIGLINDARIANGIVQFYSDYDTARANLPKLIEREDAPYTYNPDWYVSPAVRAVVGVGETVRLIQRATGLTLDVTQPDLDNSLQFKEAIAVLFDE